MTTENQYSAPEDGLPSLPEPFALSVCVRDADTPGKTTIEAMLYGKHPNEKQRLFTADQMRAYARAAVAAATGQPLGSSEQLPARSCRCGPDGCADSGCPGRAASAPADAPGIVVGLKPPSTGWTGNSDADMALILLDRLDCDVGDDAERIEQLEQIVRKMAASIASTVAEPPIGWASMFPGGTMAQTTTDEATADGWRRAGGDVRGIYLSPQAPQQALVTAGGTAPEIADVPRRQPEQADDAAERYCDGHCTWLDHAPGCVRAELTDEQILAVVAKIDPGHQYLPKALQQLARAVIAADRALRAPGMEHVNLPFQGGMDNAELQAAWERKLPSVTPTERELSAFAVGIEVGFERARDLERQDWSRVHHVLAKHGVHPGRTDDHLADIIDRALAPAAHSDTQVTSTKEQQ